MRKPAGGKAHADLHNLGKRFMWRCHYCKKTTHCHACEPSKPGLLAATRDHYFPRCQGGRGDGANIVLACFECNQRKGDAMPEDKRDWRAPLAARQDRRAVSNSGSNVEWQFDTGR